MKRTLFFLAFAAITYAGKVKAQTTTWDFTTNNPTWSASGIAANGSVAGEFIDSKGLGLHGIATNNNFAAWNTTSSATWSSPAEAFTGTIRVQTNGAGYTSTGSEATPTQRYFFIQVDGACTVKVWFKSGSSGAVRSVIASDGATVYGKATTNSGSTDGMPTDGAYLSTSITKAGTFFLYGDAAVNIYQIQVVGANVLTSPTNTLSAVDASQKNAAKVFSSGSKVYLSNISKTTEVNVYSANGALVKTLKTSADTNFDINNTGVYIVNLKSEDGVKSTKVLVK
ncbi:MAG: T9SS type A sorting domain-containing protein [Bergeyella sp.]